MTALVIFHAIVVAVLAALAIQAIASRLATPALDRAPRARSCPKISVLIPARNEAERIERCVVNWASQQYPDFEVFVYDDDSSDATAAHVIDGTRGMPRVRLIRSGSLLERVARRTSCLSPASFARARGA